MIRTTDEELEDICNQRANVTLEQIRDIAGELWRLRKERKSNRATGGILGVDPDSFADWSVEKCKEIEALGWIIVPIRAGRMVQVIR